MTASEYEVAIVGGGVIGAATARALAIRGRSVILLERGELGRPIGSSRGGARIYHFAGYPNEEYLDHGIRALECWRELERDSARQILLDTGGGLSYGDGIEAQAELLSQADRDCQLLDADEVARRWPALALPRDEPILYQRDAGVILARDALAALLTTAERAGAVLKEHVRVSALTVDGRGITLTTEAATIHARCVVVAAGPWSRQLLSTAAVDLDAHVTEQTVAWYDWTGPPPPTLIEFGVPDPFALFDPDVGLKAGLHEPGETIDDPETASGPGRERDIQRLSAWVCERFSLPATPPLQVETCRYTWTPDETFALQRHGAVVVASACSGQGFQYAPRTGELIADLAA